MSFIKDLVLFVKGILEKAKPRKSPKRKKVAQETSKRKIVKKKTVKKTIPKKAVKKKSIAKKTAKKKLPPKKTLKKKGVKRKVSSKKIVKKTPPKVKKTNPKTSTKEQGLLIGEITHYFTKIKVGVIKLKNGGVKVGDTIYIEGASSHFSQKVQSMQMESLDVKLAKKGQMVGLKVKKIARVGDLVYKQ